MKSYRQELSTWLSVTFWQQALHHECHEISFKMRNDQKVFFHFIVSVICEICTEFHGCYCFCLCSFWLQNVCHECVMQSIWPSSLFIFSLLVALFIANGNCFWLCSIFRIKHYATRLTKHAFYFGATRCLTLQKPIEPCQNVLNDNRRALDTE